MLAFTRDYLRDFDDRLREHPTDAEALVLAMNRRYAELTLPDILERGAAANVARQTAARSEAAAEAEEEAGDDADD